jgi:hypothetical protein
MDMLFDKLDPFDKGIQIASFFPYPLLAYLFGLLTEGIPGVLQLQQLKQIINAVGF